jgi:hypothetical protein
MDIALSGTESQRSGEMLKSGNIAVQQGKNICRRDWCFT